MYFDGIWTGKYKLVEVQDANFQNANRVSPIIFARHYRPYSMNAYNDKKYNALTNATNLPPINYEQ